MRVTLALLAVCSLWAGPGNAASTDGQWKVVWPCTEASGPYKDRCSNHSYWDYFELDLWSEGDRLCGDHAATAHLQNKVDETGDEMDGPSIRGDVTGDTARVSFRSPWGATGQATIRIDGDQLRWDIITRDKGQSWIPEHEVLHRVGKRPLATTRACPKEPPH
jgi:hypothetical protein